MSSRISISTRQRGNRFCRWSPRKGVGPTGVPFSPRQRSVFELHRQPEYYDKLVMS